MTPPLCCLRALGSLACATTSQWTRPATSTSPTRSSVSIDSRPAPRQPIRSPTQGNFGVDGIAIDGSNVFTNVDKVPTVRSGRLLDVDKAPVNVPFLVERVPVL
ncbi:MAG TPA: hypothetical protein VK745_14760 [Polyangiaceae bacterium]|nr:hypothetical protein [Polyangiaceae bacterium]